MAGGCVESFFSIRFVQPLPADMMMNKMQKTHSGSLGASGGADLANSPAVEQKLSKLPLMTAANAAKSSPKPLILFDGAPEGNRTLDIQLGKLRLACHIRVAKRWTPIAKR